MTEKTEETRPAPVEPHSPPPDAPATPEVAAPPDPTNNKARKYVIDFDVYHANGATEFKQIAVEAETESGAFDAAQHILSELNTAEHPITWRYRGSFKVE